MQKVRHYLNVLLLPPISKTTVLVSEIISVISLHMHCQPITNPHFRALLLPSAAHRMSPPSHDVGIMHQIYSSVSRPLF